MSSQHITPLRIHVVGALSQDVRPITDVLSRHVPQGTVIERLESLAGDGWQDHPAPDLAIVQQHWPEEFTPLEISAAFSRWPLTRWICCYGPWCNSDGRTRRVWPVSVRVPLDDFEDRLRCELMVLAGIRPPLPLTATADESFGFLPEK